MIEKDYKDILEYWNRNNKWYGMDDELTEFANTLALDLIRKNPAIDTDNLLDNITLGVKNAFPDKFKIVL